MRVLIVGCGYVGLRLGAVLTRAGHEVYGMRRSPTTAPELQAAGVQPLICDFTQREQLSKAGGGYDWVVNCASSSGGGVDGYRAVYLEGTRNLLDWLRPSPPSVFLYTSSTGVYGQNDGSVVSEDSPTEPEAESAKVLVETEQLLFAAAKARAFPAVVLRLAGIYGPGRGYWLRQFLSGDAKIEGAGARYLNMIHRDDAAGAIISAIQHGRPGDVCNVVDDEPVTQRALFEWLAFSLKRPLPESIPADNAARKRGVTNKRISNRKLREQWGCVLQYPTFREGYATEMACALHSSSPVPEEG